MDLKKLIIKNGHVLDPANGIDGKFDVVIEGSIIESVIKSGGKLPEGNVIDVSGKYVTPGLVDIHTHLREPGFEYKETIKTGSESAVAGGFTTILAMANTNPKNDNESVTRYILKKAEEALANVLPIGAVTVNFDGKTLTEMSSLKDAGCVAFSDDGMNIQDGGVVRRALEYAKSLGMAVITHAEDYCITCGGVMNEGLVSTKLGLKGFPNAAEDSVVARDIELARLTGGHIHIAHVSTRGAVEFIRQGKAKGVNVSGEAAPHHLTLTDEAVALYDTNAKMCPPLRSHDDMVALREGIADGTIESIATDHAPHALVDKDIEFDKAANGLVGFETALPLTLGLVRGGDITLNQAIAALTINPSKAMGIDYGSLGKGDRADVTIIDIDSKWTVEKDKLKSKSKNSPYIGHEMVGRAVKTIVGGKVVFEV